MKMPRFFPRKKLRASAARRSLGLPDEMDYEQMSEPNMKLSRALLIVLVLHVVAVAELNQLAGWMAYDMGDSISGRRHLQQALRMSQSVNDPALSPHPLRPVQPSVAPVQPSVAPIQPSVAPIWSSMVCRPVSNSASKRSSDKPGASRFLRPHTRQPGMPR